MSDCITFLAGLSGRWEGSGANHEGQEYLGSLIIDPVNPSAALIHFVAQGSDGTVFHRETLMVGDNGASGWQALSASGNASGIMCFSVTGPDAQKLRFTFGEYNDLSAFREEITFRIDPSEKIFRGYSWAMPGEAMQERSSAILVAKP